MLKIYFIFFIFPRAIAPLAGFHEWNGVCNPFPGNYWLFTKWKTNLSEFNYFINFIRKWAFFEQTNFNESQQKNHRRNISWGNSFFQLFLGNDTWAYTSLILHATARNSNRSTNLLRKTCTCWDDISLELPRGQLVLESLSTF